jgi:hypothetical protein
MRHILGLSGGKDSSALAVAMKERHPELEMEYVITPTGNELPEMVEHWRKLSALLEKPLTVISSGKSLTGLIQIQRALPNNRQRWCTRILKIEPYEQFLYTASPCVSYVGLRADEEGREGGLYGHIEGVEQRFPFREWGWGYKEVVTFLDERGIVIPDRTDCAWCYDQKLHEWWNLWKDHPERFRQGEEMEAAVSEIHGKSCTFRSPERDSWPAPLSELRRQFEGCSRPKHAGQMMLYGREGRCRVCSL